MSSPAADCMLEHACDTAVMDARSDRDGVRLAHRFLHLTPERLLYAGGTPIGGGPRYQSEQDQSRLLPTSFRGSRRRRVLPRHRPPHRTGDDDTDTDANQHVADTEDVR